MTKEIKAEIEEYKETYRKNRTKELKKKDTPSRFISTIISGELAEDRIIQNLQAKLDGFKQGIKRAEQLVSTKQKTSLRIICANLKVEPDTLCSFGKLGLITPRDLITPFYAELKQLLSAELLPPTKEKDKVKGKQGAELNGKENGK